MRFLKQALLILFLLLVVVLTLGCRKKSQGPISLAGSTSIQPIAETLGQKFEKDTGIRINVQGGGSSVGIEAAKNGSADVGTVSRQLTADEKQGLLETTVAKDGIAVVVNKKNKINGLTKQQLRDIFTGKIKDWRDVGGKAGPIVVVVREEGSGTRGAFEELVLGKGTPFDIHALVQNSTGGVKITTAMAPQVIGFMSMDQLDTTVKALEVDKVKLSEKAILDGRYPLSRPFLFVIKGKPKGNVKKFIDFVLSKEGQNIIRESGVVPVK